MNSLSIPDAIAKVHQKDKEVRTACLPFDRAIVFRVRREYMLSMDHSQWSTNVAGRLELRNKDHRVGLRMSLHNLHNKLRKLYGDADNRASADSEDADMESRHAGAVNLCHRVEGLMREVATLRDTYGNDPAVPVNDRVFLRRAIPRFKKQFDEAMKKKENIVKVADEWMPYFVTLTSKDALDHLIEVDHSMKIHRKVFLDKARPHCENLARLFLARNTLVSDSSRLSFRLETAWLSFSSQTVPAYRVDRELRKFDAFLASAQQQEAEHNAIEKALQELSDFAASPNVIPGLDGREIDYACLKEAYYIYRQFVALLDATTKVCLAHTLVDHTAESLA
ncbi:hypothetical protein K466DRAFT_504456 [Polyporus arcularius HHB13444]|uniref:Uncharacterized protein n=1 Tax=Polyporus arcularius HHB13444 TaxID=1314778 RepID=A0A5C3NU58_9APHY|nr:hypothetical protein K466DRAFT_504456 [Polyporus arcularius HHB13444]